MTEQELIDSGELELYVAGKLSDQRMQEITTVIKQKGPAYKETLAIERALRKFTTALSPLDTSHLFPLISQRIHMNEMRSNAWIKYVGWAACLLFFFGMGYFYVRNNSLQDEISTQRDISSEISSRIDSLQQSREQLELFTEFAADPATKKYVLSSQQDSGGDVTVFRNDKTGKIYLNLEALPEPPQNMVYQLWSLKMEPLTPTSLGTLDNPMGISDKALYAIEDSYETEGYGITLEKAGGSKTPTLDRLYVLGTLEQG